MEVGTQAGMHTIDASLAHLANGRFISLQDAIDHARDPDFIREHVHLPTPPAPTS
jgi:Tfp pilus assembly ATPase PilU